MSECKKSNRQDAKVAKGGFSEQHDKALEPQRRKGRQEKARASKQGFSAWLWGAGEAPVFLFFVYKLPYSGGFPSGWRRAAVQMKLWRTA
ncbi:MAG: hypothetical protein U0694_26590 [Anaerolineae bacterium]